MTQKPAKAANWSQIKEPLKEFNREQLLALIKDLHDYSTQNRDFLAARFAGSESAAEPSAALESYRQRIIKCFPLRGYSSPKLREARAALRQYQKATSDLPGILELMLTYVESGTSYTNEFGDIDEAFYDSLSSVLNEMEKQFASPEGAALYARFRDRMRQLQHDTRHIGWGYGDDVSYCVGQCEEAHTAWLRANPPQDTPAAPDW